MVFQSSSAGGAKPLARIMFDKYDKVRGVCVWVPGPRSPRLAAATSAI